MKQCYSFFQIFLESENESISFRRIWIYILGLQMS